MFIASTYNVKCAIWNVHICAMWQCKTLIMDMPAIIMVCTRILLLFFRHFTILNPASISFKLSHIWGLGQYVFWQMCTKSHQQIAKRKVLQDLHLNESSRTRSTFQCALWWTFSDVRLKVANTSCGLQLILHTDSSSLTLALMSKKLQFKFKSGKYALSIDWTHI